jgi:hypothetical protein
VHGHDERQEREDDEEGLNDEGQRHADERLGIGRDEVSSLRAKQRLALLGYGKIEVRTSDGTIGWLSTDLQGLPATARKRARQTKDDSLGLIENEGGVILVSTRQHVL